ncbi:MAG: DUF4262 domain-containing protein [Sphingobium sp.]|nr:DUF4262 domain-containing protein [Sphingobium sp.]
MIFDTSPFYRRIQENIDRYGQFLMAVFPTRDDPGHPFVYTIGNALKGLPELIIVGPFDAQLAGTILNKVGEIMRAAGQALPEEVDMGGTFPIRTRIAAAAAKTEWTIQVGRYLEHDDYTVQQLLLCDPQGRYPGETSIEPSYDVPLI